MQDDSPPEAESNDSDRSTRRTFLKGAAGAGAALVGTGVTGTAAAADQLVVDSYDDGLSSNNDLGKWTGAGGYTHGVSGGTLRLEFAHEQSGYYKTKVGKDVTAYDQLAFDLREEASGDADSLELRLGSTNLGSLPDATEGSIGTSFSTVTVPLDELSVDLGSFPTINVKKPWGAAAGAIEIEEIRFETADSSTGGSSTEKPEPQISDLPDSVTTGEYIEPTPSADPQTSSVEVLTWDFGDGTTTNATFPTYSYDDTDTFEVTLTYEYSDDTTASTSQMIDVRSSGPEPSISGLPDGPTTELTHQFVAGADPQTSTVQVVTWDFDDGSTSKEIRPYHTYDDFGTYEVTLTYEYSDGTTDSTSQTLEIETPDPVFEVNEAHRRVPEESTYETEITLENPEVLVRDGFYRLSYRGNEKVVDATGFAKDQYDNWSIKEYHPSPSITVRETDPYPLEETENLDGGSLYRYGKPKVDLSYLAVDADWDITYDRSIDGPGFRSEKYDLVYFGEADWDTTSTAGGDLLVIHPSGRTQTTSLEDVLQGLTEYAEYYDAGASDGTFAGIALPSSVRDGALGIAGGNDFWVYEDDDISTVDSTWIHEWVHLTDPVDDEAEDLKWFSEGYAEYMAYLAPLELRHKYDSQVCDSARFDVFANELEYGLEWNHPVDLTDTSQWGDGDSGVDPSSDSDRDNSNYYYGAIVLGAIDKRIREADASKDIIDVVDQLGDLDQPNHGDLIDTIAAVANWNVALDADAWITNSKTPSVWTESEHEAAFGYQV